MQPTSPPPTDRGPVVPSREQDLASARSYLLGALFLQVVFSSVDLYEFSPKGMYWLGWPSFAVLAAGGAALLGLAVVGGFYGIAQGKLTLARPVLLLLGALGIPFGLGIVGVLYLVAWWKVGRALKAGPVASDIFLPVVPGPTPEPVRPPPLSSVAVPPVVYRSSSTPTPGNRRCPFCQSEVPVSSPVCPRCGGTEPPTSLPSPAGRVP